MDFDIQERRPPAPGHAGKVRMLFLHIPKTAGTSFLATLGNLFGESHVRRLPWDAFSPERLRQLSAEADWSDTDCVAGHFPVHALAGRGAEFSLFTLLRHPVDRVFSLYRFLQRRPAEDLARMGLAQDFDFNAFLDSRSAELFGQVRNGMCRLLCGLPEMSDAEDRDFWRGDRDVEMAERSLALLRTTAFGLAERMPDTLHLLGELMRVRAKLSEHAENRSGPPGPEWTTRNVMRVAALNMGDLALYHAAERLFRERIAQLGGLPDVDHAAFAPTLGEAARICDIPGRHGFHSYEAGLGFAWVMGLGPALVDVAATPGRLVVHITLYRVAESYPAEEVTLEVNGVELGHRWTPTEYGFGVLESEPFEARPTTRISLRVPYAVPARFVAPRSADTRALSVAVATLTLLRA